MTQPSSTQPSLPAAPGPGLRVALSSNLMHPDPDRVFYPHSTLAYTDTQMAAWLSSTGALGYLISPSEPQGAVSLHDYADDLDGLLLTGGADVSPSSYGEEPLRPQWAGDAVRDRYEIDLIRAFVDAGKPVLGVCRGAQILNVAYGGTMYQDITTQCPGSLVHRSQERYHHNLHEVDLLAGTYLASLYPGIERATINTIHHQAVKDLGADIVVEAVSTTDGVIEAIRVDEAGVWALGVQWHPEFIALTPEHDLLDTAPVLEAFLSACATARAATT